MYLASIDSAEFAQYGRIVRGYGLPELIEALGNTPMPPEGVSYLPSDPRLEGTEAFSALGGCFYGGMPIQIGFCNGHNRELCCLEFHRDSEVNAAADDIVLLLGRVQDIEEDGRYDLGKLRAFFCPAGMAVELYATTLHYAPCGAEPDAGFRVAVVLPRGTNTPMERREPENQEDRMLWGKNKWLLSHADTRECGLGAYVGLYGEPIRL